MDASPDGVIEGITGKDASFVCPDVERVCGGLERDNDLAVGELRVEIAERSDADLLLCHPDDIGGRVFRDIVEGLGARGTGNGVGQGRPNDQGGHGLDKGGHEVEHAREPPIRAGPVGLAQDVARAKHAAGRVEHVGGRVVVGNGGHLDGDREVLVRWLVHSWAEERDKGRLGVVDGHFPDRDTPLAAGDIAAELVGVPKHKDRVLLGKHPGKVKVFSLGEDNRGHLEVLEGAVGLELGGVDRAAKVLVRPNESDHARVKDDKGKPRAGCEAHDRAAQVRARRWDQDVFLDLAEVGPARPLPLALALDIHFQAGVGHGGPRDLGGRRHVHQREPGRQRVCLPHRLRVQGGPVESDQRVCTVVRE